MLAAVGGCGGGGGAKTEATFAVAAARMASWELAGAELAVAARSFGVAAGRGCCCPPLACAGGCAAAGLRTCTLGRMSNHCFGGFIASVLGSLHTKQLVRSGRFTISLMAASHPHRLHNQPCSLGG